MLANLNSCCNNPNLSVSYSQAFFKQNNVPQESRFNLKKNVEEEYRKWKSMANENDIITHFSMQGSPPLFLCLLWKMLLETDHINQIGFRFGYGYTFTKHTLHIQSDKSKKKVIRFDADQQKNIFKCQIKN